MSITFETSLVFFNLTGMSLKAFCRTRNFLHYFIFIWSYLAAAFNIFFAIFVVIETKIGDNSPEIVLFLQIYHAIFCFCTFSCIFISLACKSSEEKLWKFLKMLEKQLFVSVPDELVWKSFRKNLLRFSMLFLVPIVIAYFAFSSHTRVLNFLAFAIYVPMLYCHIFLFKLIFYLELLSFHAEELIRKSISTIDINLPKKAYKTLYIIYKHLSKTFSFGVLIITLAQFISIILCCYHILLGEKFDLKNFGIYLTLLVTLSVSLKTASQARRFEILLKRAGHVMASNNSHFWTSNQESFHLQLMHQRLSFSVLKLFSFDNKHITKVR